MKRVRSRRQSAATGILVLIAVAAALASARAAGSFDLSWWTVDGGGGTFSSGGSYALGGTAGQPDAGVLRGGTYNVGGGFWNYGYTPAIQWGVPPGAPGAALAPPGILWDAQNNTQVFVAGNSGLKSAYSGTGRLLWSQNLHGADQARGPIIPVGGANRVFATSQDGWVTALTAADGGLYWQAQIADGLTGLVVAGVSYQPNAGPGGHGLIFAGTYTNTNPAANTLYALDATNGAPVWSFTCGGCAGGLGLVTTRPAVNPAAGMLYFGTQNVMGGSGGGIWAVRTSDGALLWSRTDLGSVNTSNPTLSDDGQTLYVGTGGAPVATLYALDTANSGATRWSWNTSSGTLRGIPWEDGGYVYVSAGNSVYALDLTTHQPNPAWPAGGAVVPGAGSPLVLTLPGHTGLYAGSSDGGFYRISLATGSILRRLALGSAAVGDPTYDHVRDAFYLCANGVLYSIQGGF